MTTEQGNRLIENFVGKDFHERLCYNEFGGIDYSECRGFYHSSWDWLMPVVEKIEKDVSASIFYGFTVEIRDLHCTIWCHERGKQDGVVYQTPYGHRPNSKIEAVWQAVVPFIQWYNSTTQTTDNGQ